MSITIELPFPPSANKYWRVVRNRIIKSGEARTYDRILMHLLLEYSKQIMQWNIGGGCNKPGWKQMGKDSRTLALSVAVHYPKRSGALTDIDNLLKIMIDCLEGVLFENDRQFRHIQISREAQTTKEGSIRVTIKKCPDELEVHDGTFIVKGIH